MRLRNPRVFDDAAQAQVERLRRPQRPSAALCSHATGYFTLAGQPEPARVWAAHALADRLEQLARGHLVRSAPVELIEAERDRNLDAADAAIVGLAKCLAADRVPPHVTGSGNPLVAWDWLEPACETRARIAGETIPTHERRLDARARRLAPRGPARGRWH